MKLTGLPQSELWKLTKQNKNILSTGNRDLKKKTTWIFHNTETMGEKTQFPIKAQSFD